MNAVKEQMIKIITEQPDDSNFEEILYELSFYAMVNRGLRDSQNNNFISTKELKEEIKKW